LFYSLSNHGLKFMIMSQEFTNLLNINTSKFVTSRLRKISFPQSSADLLIITSWNSW